MSDTTSTAGSPPAGGSRADDRTPGILVGSPLSRAGYLYATAVGLVWGAIWSTGRVERRGGLIVFRGLPAWSFGRGGSCVGGCYLTNQNVSADVLEHEAVHKKQWQRYGMLFPLLYLAAGRDPLKNRFEIEAGLEKGGYLRRPRARRPGRTATQDPAQDSTPDSAQS